MNKLVNGHCFFRGPGVDTFLFVGTKACSLLVDSGLEAIKSIEYMNGSKEHVFVRITKDGPVAQNGQDIVIYFESIKKELYSNAGEYLVSILLQLQLSFLEKGHNLEEALNVARSAADKLRLLEMESLGSGEYIPEGAMNGANWKIIDPEGNAQKNYALHHVLLKLCESKNPDNIRAMMETLKNVKLPQLDLWHRPRRAFVQAMEAVIIDLS